MKKFILSIGVGLGLTLSSYGQYFMSQDLLNVRSLMTSNLLNFTNIISYGVFHSNLVGQVWTNGSGTRVTVSAGSFETTTIVKDAELWPNHNGSYPPLYYVAAGTNDNSTPLQAYQPSPFNLYARISGGSGANSAVTFRFIPLCDGVNESTVAGDIWQFAITANGATPVALNTNVPLYKWPGCNKLRLLSVTDGDTDASSQVFLTDLSINGWRF